jgi:hypothetical protein
MIHLDLSFETFVTKVPADGSDGPEHVARCYMVL